MRAYRTLKLATPFNLNDVEGVERSIDQTRNEILDRIIVAAGMVLFIAVYCLLP